MTRILAFCESFAGRANRPTLALVDRVGDFDFGAKERIVAIAIDYPIDS